jgi:hypothetical protein
LPVPGEAGPQQADDAEGHVVDVASTRGDVAERPAFGADRMGDRPHGYERRQEADVAEEESLLARFGQVLAVERRQDLGGQQRARGRWQGDAPTVLVHLQRRR